MAAARNRPASHFCSRLCARKQIIPEGLADAPACLSPRELLRTCFSLNNFYAVQVQPIALARRYKRTSQMSTRNRTTCESYLLLYGCLHSSLLSNSFLLNH